MIPIQIVAHPDRAEMAEKLAVAVDAQVTFDIRRPPVMDNHIIGCAATHLKALNSLLATARVSRPSRPSEPWWVVVLEDDAVVCDDFRGHLVAALAVAPAPVVGLYLGTGNPSGEAQRQIRQAVMDAQAQHKAWIRADCLIGSVGYAVFTDRLEDMVDFIGERDEELPLRISRWAQERRLDICYTQPSLIDHLDGESINRPWRGPHYLARRAWNHGTRACWDTPAVRLGHCPVWSTPRE